MKPEAQRIAIAEACGWTNLHHEEYRDKIVGMPDTFLTGTPPANDKTFLGFPPCPPRYVDDLNAMHEAEKALDKSQWHQYSCYLGRHDTWNLIHANATQRAEALLRTIGKWTKATYQ